MKTTALNAIHREMGGKMVDFAGFDMPVQFEGINIEHETVRTKVGVFDVSHMGEFWVEGPNAFKLVQHISTNDVAALVDGKVQYSCFPNGKGGIVDDFLCYRFSVEKYLLVVNAANIEKDWAFVNEQNTFGAKLTNASDDISQLAVQGPLALKAMQSLTSEPVEDMVYYTFKVVNFAGVDDVIFSTTGYTGSGGCEIYMKNEDAPKIYKACWKQVRLSVLNLLAWEPGTRCDWSLVFAFTVMISTILPRRLLQDWAGSPNLWMATISSTGTSSLVKRKTEYPEGLKDSSWKIVPFHASITRYAMLKEM